MRNRSIVKLITLCRKKKTQFFRNGHIWRLKYEGIIFTSSSTAVVFEGKQMLGFVAADVLEERQRLGSAEANAVEGYKYEGSLLSGSSTAVVLEVK